MRSSSCQDCNYYRFSKMPSFITALSTTIGVTFIIALLSVAVQSQDDIYLRKAQLQGPYCASRPEHNRCCDRRQDSCSVPILGTLCYCDEFCNRTHARGYDDCCPDYLPVCLNISIPSELKRRCYFNGRFMSDGEALKINCNLCVCHGMGDMMNITCDQQECIINTGLIDLVNNQWNRFGWKARNYSEFWGKTLSEGISSRLGTILSARKVLAMNPISPDYDSQRLPRSFDARKKWRGFIELPRDQGWCGASWAISTVGVISDRMNIQLGSHHTLSPQHLLSCNTRNQPGSGCNGGHLTRAWIFIRRFGLVQEKCFPWVGHRTTCVIPKRKTANESRCASPYMQRSPLHRVAPVYRIAGEQDIMYEIQKSGPVQATMRVYQDFFSYGGGIYRCTNLSKESRTGYHSVKIIGWGEEYQSGRLEKYWIVANSWGLSWGENGYFRIRRGNNDCKIEDFVLAAWAAQEKTSTINFKDPTSIDNTISNVI